LFVQLCCGFVVCFGGLHFILEVAQVLSFAVADYRRAPHAFIAGEPDALVSGARTSLFRVPRILSDGRQTQICPAVVEAAAVYVVDYISVRNAHQLAVHEDARVSAVGPAHRALRVEHALAPCPANPPLVPAQTCIIIRVHDCEQALRERDSAEGIAVANTSVHHQQSQQNLRRPVGNRDGKIEPDKHPPVDEYWPIRLSGSSCSNTSAVSRPETR